MATHRTTSASTNAAVPARWLGWLTDMGQLVKLRLTLTVVFSALMAFVIVAKGDVTGRMLLMLGLGGFFTTGAANALNQVLEKDFDALMKRTADRPIVAGRMSSSEAVMAAGLMCLLGISALAMFNPWAALFGMMALVSYSFMYTPLKRVSTLAVDVGAVAGALPMLIGCVAYQGELTWMGLAMFGIQFFWQYPHFYAIGWLGYEDYEKAGYRFIWSRDGRPHPYTGLRAALCSLAIVPLVWVPYFYEFTGLFAPIFGTVLALAYAAFGWHLQKRNDRKAALALMFSSFAFLPLVLLAMWLDQIL